MAKVIMFLILILFSIESADGLLSPKEYPIGSCELVAKDFKKAFSDSSLVLLLPIGSNGDYEKGDKIGHWVNAIHWEGNTFYIDWVSQSIFKDKKDLQTWYNKKLNLRYGQYCYNIDKEDMVCYNENGYVVQSQSGMWDLGLREYPPNGIIWNYP